MAAKKRADSDSDADPQPFGAGAVETKSKSTAPRRKRAATKKPAADAEAPAAGDAAAAPRTAKKKATKKKAAKRTKRAAAGSEEAPAEAPAAEARAPRAEPDSAPAPAEAREAREGGRSEREPAQEGREDRATGDGQRQGRSGSGTSTEDGPPRESARQARRRRWQERRKRRRKKGGGGQGGPQGEGGPRQDTAPRREGEKQRGGGQRGEQRREPAEKREVEGLLFVEKANHGHLRMRENSYLPSKQDTHVPPRLVQKYDLREGSILTGQVRRGQGRHKWELIDVDKVDGKDPNEVKHLTTFKKLTSIDPDFHYAVGDISGETTMKVLDLLAPVGRGQRGLIVAPPRSGKTILMRDFAKAIEKGYPEVHLIVLLIDERPEEATEWTRTIENGEVFVSTNDEMPKRHVELAEAVWRRCRRLVELGEDVIVLLDSITRLGRAYNNVKGDSGRTMSGGLDTRALERPKQFFGAARNTETAGSLTILGTTLIETGSRMDQVIFEEFKGTGNMELVLSRKLADRRIFPAIDIVKTGTRKDEKLHSSKRLMRVNTLRRVLTRMHWAEAMELLSTKLDDVERIDDFLERFEIDPEE